MVDLCFDTSGLISAWARWYSPEHHWAFWEGIAEHGRAGKVHISEEVYEEIKKETQLYKWLDARRGLFFRPTGSDITNAMIEISRRHQAAFTSKAGYKDPADPYVIGLAKLKGAIVITDEREASQLQKDGTIVAYKIPSVCIAERVLVGRPYDIIKLAGWKFVLDNV